MKATGIVRRIDELGRVVIPKEIRRTLRIREGDSLEIFTDTEGSIIFRKFSHLGELGLFAKQYAESLHQSTGHLVIITDCEKVVAVCGEGKNMFEDQPITEALQTAINHRKNFVASKEERNYIKLIENQDDSYVHEAVSTIISEGDAIGAVILYEKDPKKKLGEPESKMAMTAAGFLGKQVEQ